MAYAIGRQGSGVLRNLGKLVLTLYGALGVRRRGAGRGDRDRANPGAALYCRRSRAISDRVLDRLAARRRCRSRSKIWKSSACRQHIVAFVLPSGYSFNLDGTTLYLSVAALFVAQAAGVHMALGSS